MSGYSCSEGTLSLGVNASNQINNTGFSYDVSGNMSNDGTNAYGWDAESQIKSAAGVNYLYDGDGNRVQKSNGKLYWYGAGSEVLDESDLSGNFTDEYVFFGGKRIAHRVVSSGSIYYYAEDFLGSSRVVTTATGSVCYDADFLPYGTERTVTNTCPQNYKFTGKERDSESNLDNLSARYKAFSIGRFMSPDPMGGHNEDPQTLNRYGYVRNNPLNLSDLTGLDFYLFGGKFCDHGVACDDKGFILDASGHRQVVTSDSIRNGDNSATVGSNGVEVTTGGNTYQAEYFENPDSIKMENVNGESMFVDHNQITLGGKAGSGLENFSFFVNGNCAGTCLASGTFDFNATPDETRNYLDAHGAFRSIVDRTIPLYGASLDEEFFHPRTTQHRFGEGPSLHVSVPRDPSAMVPTMGLFHVDKDAPGLAHAGCAWFGLGCH